MPAIHSTLNKAEGIQCMGMTLLPFKSKVKGTAPPAPEGQDDIVDEAIALFRANVLFASFDIDGPADRLLVYLTLYIQQCLVRMDAKGVKTKKDAEKIMIDLAREQFPMPGEAGWALGGHIPAAKSRTEADQCRAYLKHIREEIGMRMLDCVFYPDGNINKFWMAYSKKKFMNIPVT